MLHDGTLFRRDKEAEMTMNRKTRQGFALIFVLLIGAAMLAPVLMLLSAAAPERTRVTGQQVSDQVLAAADGVVNRIETTIQTFPSLLGNPSGTLASGLSSLGDGASMAKYAVSYLLSNYLNGCDCSTEEYLNRLSSVQTAVSTYLYDEASEVLRCVEFCIRAHQECHGCWSVWRYYDGYYWGPVYHAGRSGRLPRWTRTGEQTTGG